MVMVDQMIKKILFFSLTHLSKTSKLVEEFMETIQKIHGTLNIIISDGDPIFTRNF